jgi:alkylhydroperoxidase family enzyme
MSKAVDRLREQVIERALHAPGETKGDARRAAYDGSGSPLVEKVAAHAWKVTDEDIAAAKQAGLSEDALFELVVCAAVGQATRQLDAALAVLEETP